MGVYQDMRHEHEIRLKRAYWQGVYDALCGEGKSKSDKLERERLTAENWLTSLDWILAQPEETEDTQKEVEYSRD